MRFRQAANITFTKLQELIVMPLSMVPATDRPAVWLASVVCALISVTWWSILLVLSTSNVGISESHVLAAAITWPLLFIVWRVTFKNRRVPTNVAAVFSFLAVHSSQLSVFFGDEEVHISTSVGLAESILLWMFLAFVSSRVSSALMVLEVFWMTALLWAGHEAPSFLDVISRALLVMAFALSTALCVTVYTRSIETTRKRLKNSMQANLELLSELMPIKFARRLLHDPEQTLGKSEILDNCVFFCADLQGFTSMSRSLGPQMSICLLSRLFSVFDAIVRHHGVHKHATVGDGYEAIIHSRICHVEGLTLSQRCARMLTFAADFHLSTQMLRSELNAMVRRGSHDTESTLNIRIGIHVGSTNAVVVGTAKPQLSLVSHAIVESLELEQSALTTHIHASKEFASHLRPSQLKNLEVVAMLRKDGSVDFKTKDSSWRRRRIIPLMLTAPGWTSALASNTNSLALEVDSRIRKFTKTSVDPETGEIMVYNGVRRVSAHLSSVREEQNLGLHSSYDLQTGGSFRHLGSPSGLREGGGSWAVGLDFSSQPLHHSDSTSTFGGPHSPQHSASGRNSPTAHQKGGPIDSQDVPTAQTSHSHIASAGTFSRVRVVRGASYGQRVRSASPLVKTREEMDRRDEGMESPPLPGSVAHSPPTIGLSDYITTPTKSAATFDGSDDNIRKTQVNLQKSAVVVGVIPASPVLKGASIPRRTSSPRTVPDLGEKAGTMAVAESNVAGKEKADVPERDDPPSFEGDLSPPASPESTDLVRPPTHGSVPSVQPLTPATISLPVPAHALQQAGSTDSFTMDATLVDISQEVCVAMGSTSLAMGGTTAGAVCDSPPAPSSSPIPSFPSFYGGEYSSLHSEGVNSAAGSVSSLVAAGPRLTPMGVGDLNDDDSDDEMWASRAAKSTKGARTSIFQHRVPGRYAADSPIGTSSMMGDIAVGSDHEHDEGSASDGDGSFHSVSGSGSTGFVQLNHLKKKKLRKYQEMRKTQMLWRALSEFSPFIPAAREVPERHALLRLLTALSLCVFFGIIIAISHDDIPDNTVFREGGWRVLALLSVSLGGIFLDFPLALSFTVALDLIGVAASANVDSSESFSPRTQLLFLLPLQALLSSLAAQGILYDLFQGGFVVIFMAVWFAFHAADGDAVLFIIPVHCLLSFFLGDLFSRVFAALLSRSQLMREELVVSKTQSTALIDRLIPSSLRLQLLQPVGRTTIVDEIECVSIMFVKFWNMEDMIEQLGAVGAGDMLHKVHSALEDCVDAVGAYKVESVRNSLVVSAGSPSRVFAGEIHSTALLQCALDMHRVVEVLSEEYGTRIPLGIGLSCGKCMAGPVGVEKRVWKLVSPHMNLAARLMAKAPSDSIYLSRSYVKRLRQESRMPASALISPLPHHVVQSVKEPLSLKGYGSLKVYEVKTGTLMGTPRFLAAAHEWERVRESLASGIPYGNRNGDVAVVPLQGDLPKKDVDLLVPQAATSEQTMFSTNSEADGDDMSFVNWAQGNSGGILGGEDNFEGSICHSVSHIGRILDGSQESLPGAPVTRKY